MCYERQNQKSLQPNHDLTKTKFTLEKFDQETSKIEYYKSKHTFKRIDLLTRIKYQRHVSIYKGFEMVPLLAEDQYKHFSWIMGISKSMSNKSVWRFLEYQLFGLINTITTKWISTRTYRAILGPPMLNHRMYFNKMHHGNVHKQTQRSDITLR